VQRLDLARAAQPEDRHLWDSRPVPAGVAESSILEKVENPESKLAIVFYYGI
jgi:hypothetical protein